MSWNLDGIKNEGLPAAGAAIIDIIDSSRPRIFLLQGVPSEADASFLSEIFQERNYLVTLQHYLEPDIRKPGSRPRKSDLPHPAGNPIYLTACCSNSFSLTGVMTYYLSKTPSELTSRHIAARSARDSNFGQDYARAVAVTEVVENVPLLYAPSESWLDSSVQTYIPRQHFFLVNVEIYPSEPLKTISTEILRICICMLLRISPTHRLICAGGFNTLPDQEGSGQIIHMKQPLFRKLSLYNATELLTFTQLDVQIPPGSRPMISSLKTDHIWTWNLNVGQPRLIVVLENGEYYHDDTTGRDHSILVHHVAVNICRQSSVLASPHQIVSIVVSNLVV